MSNENDFSELVSVRYRANQELHSANVEPFHPVFKATVKEDYIRTRSKEIEGES